MAEQFAIVRTFVDYIAQTLSAHRAFDHNPLLVVMNTKILPNAVDPTSQKNIYSCNLFANVMGRSSLPFFLICPCMRFFQRSLYKHAGFSIAGPPHK